MLVGIYCVWDHELLRASVDNILKSVDKVIIVYSNFSNYGDFMRFPIEEYKDCILVQHEPSDGQIPHKNEQAKRNRGLEEAKKIGAKYLITMDQDEFYQEGDVRFWYEYLKHCDVDGLVCRSHVYFGSPTLTIGEDVTFVPFIHKITANLKFVFTPDYPYTKHEGKLRIDPTRRFNLTTNVRLIGCIMHHMSWVRSDYNDKIDNSSAGSLKKIKQEILVDLQNAKEGYFVKSIYQKELKLSPNLFNL